MLLTWLFACATTPDPAPAAPSVPVAPSSPVAPPSTIPELATPAPPTTPRPRVDDPARAFAGVPQTVSNLYRFTLPKDAASFTVDPNLLSRRDVRATRGFSSEPTKAGGRSIRLDGGAITRASWTQASLGSLLTNAADRQKVTAAGYPLDTPRDILTVQAAGDVHPTHFAFSADPRQLGLVGICEQATLIDFSSPVQMTVRKPVIYVTPERSTWMHLEVHPSGPFLATYPETTSGWDVIAHPDGRLDTNGRSLRYLFWEAGGADFTLDPAQAHLVDRDEAVPFLHRACDAYALTDEQCADYVTYWLPEFKAHPYTLVSFLDEPYTRWAPLTVTPEPDTLIRLYMVIQGTDQPVATGSPGWPAHQPRGLTVTEWGGSSLEVRRKR